MFSPFSSFCWQKGKRRKKTNEKQRKGKMSDLPANFSLLYTWILSVMPLKTLKRTTCFEKSLCKIRNTSPFKTQFYFSSHFPLNSQVHVQAAATEGTISSCMQTWLISCAFFLFLRNKDHKCEMKHNREAPEYRSEGGICIGCTSTQMVEKLKSALGSWDLYPPSG